MRDCLRNTTNIAAAKTGNADEYQILHQVLSQRKQQIMKVFNIFNILLNEITPEVYIKIWLTIILKTM